MSEYCYECGKVMTGKPCDHLALDGHPILRRSQYPALDDNACGAYLSPSEHPSTVSNARCRLPEGHYGEHKFVEAT